MADGDAGLPGRLPPKTIIALLTLGAVVGWAMIIGSVSLILSLAGVL